MTFGGGPDPVAAVVALSDALADMAVELSSGGTALLAAAGGPAWREVLAAQVELAAAAAVKAAEAAAGWKGVADRFPHC